MLHVQFYSLYARCHVMMNAMRTWAIILTCCFCWTQVVTQDLLPGHDLAFYADVMSNAVEPEHRRLAHAHFVRILKSRLMEQNIGSSELGDLTGVMVLTPQDSAFRLITWQLTESDSQYRYGGFIQRKDRPSDLIALQDTRSLRSEHAGHDHNTWYGALYYGIQPFTMRDSIQAYLILGFNAMDAQLNQKVADVLIVGQERAEFGRDVFIHRDSTGTDVKKRIILEYADAAAGRMQIDRERGLLVYDHVITIFTNGPEAGPLLVPDGSFHGYRLEDGEWHFIDKIFNTQVDTPPGEGLPDDGVKRDLFGRPIRN